MYDIYRKRARVHQTRVGSREIESFCSDVSEPTKGAKWLLPPAPSSHQVSCIACGDILISSALYNGV